MADTVTTTLGLTKPEVGASEDSWGEKINTNFDLVDDALDGTTAVSLDINGGTIDGAVIGGATPAAGTFTTLTANTSLGGTLSTAAQPNVTSVGTLTSLDVSGNVTFGDNDKAIFGAGSDLQIYHNGGQSIIEDAGQGNLVILATDFYLNNSANTENMLSAINDGAVTLYYNGSPKLATTSTGVDITGTLTSDGLTVDGDVDISSATPSVTIKRTNTANEMGFTFLNANDVESFKYFINGNNNDLTFQSREANVLKLEQGGDISFYEDTGTTPKFFWDASAESLGIGTSSPSANLEISSTVQPTIRVTDSDNSNTAFMQADGVNGAYFGTLTNHPVRLAPNNSTKMIVTTDGNVGIGTSSPAENLHISSSSGSARIRMTSADGSDNMIVFGDASDSATGAIKFDHSNNALSFNGYNNSERMRIDSSGNVGIGTSSPSDSYNFSKALDINGTGGSIIYLRTNGSTTNTSAIGNSGTDLYIKNNAAGNIRFFNNGQNTERMRIDSSGRVAIGGTTVTDVNMLNIQGSGASSNIGVVLNDTNTSKVYGIQNGGSALKFFDYTASTERMRLDASGNLLVGTTGVLSGSVDGANICVNPINEGSIRVSRSSGSNANQITFWNTNGKVGSITTVSTSTSFNTSSDYRLKTDAQPMTGASARVQALNPVNFEWIADGTRVDGFLAHEAQAIVPEAVTGTKDAMRDEEYEVTPAVLDDDGNVVTEAVMGTRSVPDYQGIDQSKLVPLLTAALQEALTKIDALETRITALEG